MDVPICNARRGLMDRCSRMLLAALLLCNSAYGQKDTILLFHPTAYILETYHVLATEVIDRSQADQVHFLGVYHMNEQYDYTQSYDFLSTLPQDDAALFSLHGIHGKVDINNVYSSNVFSPQFDSLFSISRGAIFNGGPDIPPELYGEPMNLLTRVTDPWRHYMEVTAMSMLLGTSWNSSIVPYLDSHPSYLVLGICLGMQTMNVATGGTLIQDIPTEVYALHSREEVLENPGIMHRNYHFDMPGDTILYTGYHFHPVHIRQSGKFHKWFVQGNNSPVVLSSHHQAVESLGKGLIPAAYSADQQIIEALEHEKFPAVFGVQFHPEKTGLFKDDQLNYVHQDSLLDFKRYTRMNASSEFHYRFWEKIFENF